MKRDLVKKIESSFVSCERDSEIILSKLFVESQPYSDKLKKLLVINSKDCLDENNEKYKEVARDYSVTKLRDEGYLHFAPKLILEEHEDVKSYLLFTFDGFKHTKKNPKFRDCIVAVSILCHTDHWELNGLKQRPLEIAGYIDGILNESQLSGLGKLEFLGMDLLLLDNDLSGYLLTYKAVHGKGDDTEKQGLGFLKVR